MSKLYASIDSDARKTQATSRGHREIEAHVRGWTLGVRVAARLDGNGNETFDVYVTSGSNGGAADVLLGNVALLDGFRYFFPAPSRDEIASEIQREWLERCACGEELAADGSHAGGYGAWCG